MPKNAATVFGFRRWGGSPSALNLIPPASGGPFGHTPLLLCFEEGDGFSQGRYFPLEGGDVTA
jgi:hypothetical protein